MNEKLINKVVKEQLLKESIEWDKVLSKIGQSLSSAKNEFKQFISGVMNGSFHNLDSKDVIKSMKMSPKGQQLLKDEAFNVRLKQVANNLGVSERDLIKVMHKESKLNPAAVNPKTGASGLIQFMPSTARGLGTSVEAIRRMSALEQLDYVEKYFKPYKGKIDSYEDLYMVTFFPAAVGKSDSTVLKSRNLSAELISRQNPVIARAAGKTPGDALTVADFKTYAAA